MEWNISGMGFKTTATFKCASAVKTCQNISYSHNKVEPLSVRRLLIWTWYFHCILPSLTVGMHLCTPWHSLLLTRWPTHGSLLNAAIDQGSLSVRHRRCCREQKSERTVHIAFLLGFSCMISSVRLCNHNLSNTIFKDAELWGFQTLKQCQRQWNQQDPLNLKPKLALTSSSGTLVFTTLNGLKLIGSLSCCTFPLSAWWPPLIALSL